MDNISHTLIGVGFYRMLPKKYRKPESFWASTVGNNIPDSDVLQRFFPGGDDLDYIVHHRGYTHSFLFALPLGLAVGMVVNRIFRKPAGSRLGIFVGMFAAILHILADFMNDYGIHPLTPFFNRWYYGDSVFIVEPLLWVALIPVAILTVHRKWAKTSWAIIGAGLFITLWFIPGLNRPFILLLTTAAAGLVLLILKTGKEWIGITSAVLTVLVFLGASSTARGLVTESWEHARLLDERLLDVTSTPAPGNPICWKSWIRTENEKYFVSRLAHVSLFPRIVPVGTCLAFDVLPGKALLSPNLLPSSYRVHWVAQSDLSRELHGELLSKSCRYRKFLNFVRIPYVLPLGKDGEVVGFVAGDLRYDRGREPGFADFSFTYSDVCEGSTEWWEPPTKRSGARELPRSNE
ncbi:MAG: metal-dependent hydrolase [Cryobacterium sp.]|nr:metal-dependent hydrolase [Oligoflexia bacterium]